MTGNEQQTLSCLSFCLILCVFMLCYEPISLQQLHFTFSFLNPTSVFNPTKQLQREVSGSEKSLNQFLKLLDLLSPKSVMIREVLQQRMMGNYVGLKIYSANLPSLILSVRFSHFCLKISHYLHFFSQISSFLCGAAGCDLCRGLKKRSSVCLI